MIELIKLFLVVVIIFNLINYIFLKFDFLIDGVGSLKHKNFINKSKVPITGGILFILTIIFLLQEFNIINKFIFFLIFLLGLMSDINKLTSPKVRLILQLLIVGAYIYLNNTYVNEIRIDYFDNNFLNNLIFKFIFTSFCILILINGSNFMDGVNTLCGGYFFLIFSNIIFLYSNKEINIEFHDALIITTILLIFLISNSFNKSFMGDNGSYLISFFTAIFLIEVSNDNQFLSPYFIAVLLWYPAFENFFSLSRRLFFEKKKIKIADNLHLHHLLFIFIKERFLNNKYTNTLTGLIINVFNLLVFIVANHYLYQTKVLILILVILIFSYISMYFFLKRNIKL